MSFSEISILAAGLAADSFALSLRDGMTFDKVTLKHALAVALAFGLFQVFMTLGGCYGGSFFYRELRHIDHWLVIIIFSFMGGKKIIEGFIEYHAKKLAEKEEKENVDVPIVEHNIRVKLTPRLLILQGISTSLDTLVIGVGLASVKADMKTSAAAIGTATAVFCFPGVFIGKKTGDRFTDKAHFASGFILLAVGIKVFAEHMIAGA